MRNISRKGALFALITAALMLPSTYAFATCSKDKGKDPMIQKMDQNCDGKISEKEFDHAMNKRFKALDTNHDGYIENSELKAARARVRKRMQEYRKKLQQREQQQKQGQ